MSENFEEFFPGFEKDGVLTIRARLGEMNGRVKVAAIYWLALKEEEDRARSDASQAEQASAASRAAVAAERQATAAERAAIAAERANARANIALAIAALSIIISIVTPFLHR